MSTIPSGSQESIRVAVISVHGVSDPAPNTTVEQTADALQKIRNRGKSLYEDFEKTTIRIPDHFRHSTKAKSPSVFETDQRAKCIQNGHCPQHIADRNLDQQYAEEQLRDYKVEESIYETQRISTRRETCQQNQHVDLFELHWGDLSRVGPGFPKILASFYELLFSFVGFGRQGLDFARAKQPSDWIWRWLQRLQSWGERLVVIFFPLVNLCLAAMALVMVSFQLPVSFQAISLTALGGIFLSYLLSFLIFRFTTRYQLKRWPLAVPPCLVVVALSFTFVFTKAFPLLSAHPEIVEKSLIWTLWGFGSIAILFLMHRYQRIRRGAFLAGITMVAITSALLFRHLGMKASDTLGHLWAVVATLEWLVFLAGISGIVFLCICFLSAIFGWFAPFRFHPSKRKPFEKAARLGTVTLCLSGLLIPTFALIGWQTLHSIASTLNLYPDHHHLVHPSLAPLLSKDGSQIMQLSEFLPALIHLAATPAFPVLTGILVVSLVWTVALFAPSLSLENREKLKKANAETSKKQQFSVALGLQLTRALRSLNWPRRLIVIGQIIVMPMGLILALHGETFGNSWTSQILQIAGMVFGGLLLTAIPPLRGLSGILTKKIGQLLDVALDAINWIKLHPRTSNPRSRITARYQGLLKHLCDAKNPDGSWRYQRLVITGHSQGAAISADLLRYLHQSPDPALKRLNEMPISLLTFGCPLRQLYSNLFPFQYAWAEPGNANWLEATQPAPSELAGQTTWTNLYRSGDFIGRSLWHPEDDEAAWQTDVEPLEDGTERRESCIGPGGHLLYFEGKPSQIALEIDRMITATDYLDLHVPTESNTVAEKREVLWNRAPGTLPTS